MPTDLTSAVAGGERVAEAVRDVSAAILRNDMETLPARHRRVREQAFKLSQPALRALDAALERTQREIEAVERQTATPPQLISAADAVLASEIRSRLAAMPADQRRVALRDALQPGETGSTLPSSAGRPYCAGFCRPSWRLRARAGVRRAMVPRWTGCAACAAQQRTPPKPASYSLAT